MKRWRNWGVKREYYPPIRGLDMGMEGIVGRTLFTPENKAADIYAIYKRHTNLLRDPLALF